jgi:hypothetical protein
MLRSRVCWCVLCPILGALLALLLLLTPQAVLAQEPGAKKGRVSFINDVAPILKETCFACHDSKKRKGKLDMTTYENFRKGGINDDPITPENPEDSRIIEMLTSTGADRMPPKEAGEALPKAKIDRIAQWIKEGAKLDQGIDEKADLLRELRIRWKPPAPFKTYPSPAVINALAFTPDDKKLVAGAYHELTVWDVATGKLEKRVSTRAQRAKALAFLPDGKLAVAGSRPGEEGDVRIYDLNAPGKVENGVTILDGVNDPKVLIKELFETDDEVLCLAVSPDGKKLAAAGCDRLVKVWDLSEGYDDAKLEQSIENHADWVFGVTFSPDGKYLLTASRDKTAKVWDLKAKELVLTFPDHQNAVYGVAVKADGKVGYSVGEDNQLRFFNAVGEGKQIRAVPGHTKAVTRVAYHADPKTPLLATCSADGTVKLWNPDNGTAVRTLTGHNDWLYALAISTKGTLIAAAGYNGEVRIWKTADGALERSFYASPGYVPTVAVTPKN